MSLDARQSESRSSRFSVPTLAEIFWGPLANGFRKMAEWRKRGILGEALQAHRRRAAMRFETLEPRILLSADLTHAAPAGAALDATLRVDDAGGAPILRLIDNPSSTILGERLIDQDIDVHVFGNDQSDKLRIGFDRALLAHQIRVNFDGGEGGIDELIGSDQANTWLLDGAGSGSSEDGTFTGVERVQGGTADDTFVVLDPSATTAVDGGAGNDTLVAADVDNTWAISGEDSGTLNDQTFGDVENLTGGSGADVFAFAPEGRVSGTVRGGEGDDTLIAADTDNTWVISGEDAGTLNGQSFAEIENLTGGAGSDTFIFAGGSISGTIDGGAGVNTFDYSSRTNTVTVDLEAGAATDVAAMVNVTRVVGGAGNDTLVGRNEDSVWSVSGPNAGSVGGVEFAQIENLSGGADSDTFVFTEDGDLDGIIVGGLGVDYLQGANSTNTWILDGENAGSLNGVAFVDIENLLGGDDSDVFELLAAGGLAGIASGGLGTDRFRGPERKTVWRFTGNGSGNAGGVKFSGMESLEGGAGEDTLVGPAENSIWTVDGPNSGNVGGVSFSGMENLEGAADNEDTFVFEDGGSVSGVLNGGTGGFDTLVVNFTGVNTLIYDAHGPDSGEVHADGNVIKFVGLEPVTIGGTADNLIVDASAGDDNLTLQLDPDDPTKLALTDGGAPPTIEEPRFAMPTTSLLIRLNSGNDLLTIGDVGTFDLSKLIVDGDAPGEAGTDEIRITRDADMALSDTSLTVDGAGITLIGIEAATLTGGGSENAISVSNWGGQATLDGAGANDTYTVDFAGSGTGTVAINDTGGTGDSLTVNGTAANETIVLADTLSGAAVSLGSESVSYSGIEDVTVAGGNGDDTFDVSDFTGTATLDGEAGTNSVQATKDHDFALTNATLASTDGMSLTLSGIQTANLTGGAGENTFHVSGWSGNATLTGGAGDDTYAFGDAWGTATIVEAVDEGTDTLDFTGHAGTLSVSADRSQITSSDGSALQQSATPAEQAEEIDVTLTSEELTALKAGADELFEFIESLQDDLDGLAELVNQLPLIGRDLQGGLAEVAGLGSAFSQLATTIKDLGGTVKLSDVVQALNTLSLGAPLTSLVVSTDYRGEGTAAATPAASGVLEVLLDIELAGEHTQDVTIDFGAEAELIGIEVDASLHIEAELAAALTLGLSTSATPAFFIVPGATIDLEVSAAATLAEVALNLGILEASITGGTITYSGDVELTLNDPTAPTDGRVTVGELSAPLGDLLSVTTTSTFAADLPVSVATGIQILEVGDLSAAVFALELPPGASIFDGFVPDISLTAGGINLFDFANTSPTEVMGMLQQVLDSFVALARSEALKVEIPFSGGKTLGDVLDFATAFKTEILDPLFLSGDALRPDNDGDGVPDFTFLSIQGLVDRLTTALGLGTPITALYDPATNDLTFSISFDRSLGFGEAAVGELVRGGSGANEVQTVTINAVDSGGTLADTFRLAFADDAGALQFTSPIARDATAAEVAAALNALEGIGTGGVSVTQAGNVYTITFDGSEVADQNVPLLVSDASRLAGAFPISFGLDLGDIAGIEASGEFTLAAGLTAGLTFGVNLSPSRAIELTPGVFQTDTVPAALAVPVLPDNTLQVVVVRNATDGTFTLQFGDQTTGSIDYDASAASVETALEGLTGINNVSVSLYDGSSGNALVDAALTLSGVNALVGNTRIYLVEFEDPASNVSALVVDGSALKGAIHGVLSDAANFEIKLFNDPLARVLTTVEGGDGEDEEQKVAVLNAGDGTFVLDFNSAKTGPIAHDADAATVQGALEGLANIGAGNVSVAKSGTTYTITFVGDLAGTSVPQLQVESDGLKGSELGTITVQVDRDTTNLSLSDLVKDAQAAVDQALIDGGLTLGFLETRLADGETFTPEADSLTTLANDLPFILDASQVSVETSVEGGAGTNEVQVVTVRHAIGGTFTLGFIGQTTAPIAYNAEAATVKNELEALLGITEVGVAKSGTAYTITFLNPGNQNVAQLTADDSLLFGVPIIASLTKAEADAAAGLLGDDLEGVRTALELLINTRLAVAGISDIAVAIAITDDEGVVDPAGTRLSFVATGGDLFIAFPSPLKVEGGGGRLTVTAPPVRVSPFLLEPTSIVDRRIEINTEHDDPAFQEMGLLSAPTRFDGVTGDRIEFTLVANGQDVDVVLAPQAANTSLDQLVVQLQAAIDAGLVATLGSADQDRDGVADIEAFRIDADGNRIGLRADPNVVTKLALDVPFRTSLSGSNGAITELGFDGGLGETRRGKAFEFFLDNVSLEADVALLAPAVSVTASLGFLGITATGSGTLGPGGRFIEAGLDVSLRNPEDGGTKVTVGLLGEALTARQFLFDATEIGRDADDRLTTGFIDGALSGGVGFLLEIEPDGVLAGLPLDLDASLAISATSPNWLVALPTLNDPLGFGTDAVDLAAPFTLAGIAPANGQLSQNASFVIASGGFEGVGILRAADTTGFSTRGELSAALQEAVNDARARLAVASGAAVDPILVAIDASGSITLTGAAGLSVRGNVVDIDFTGLDVEKILNQFRDLSFADIIAGLEILIDFLRSLDGSGGAGSALASAVDFKLPLIDRSVADLVDIAGAFARRVEALTANPSASIQSLEAEIRTQLGIPDAFPPVLSFDPVEGVLGINFSFGTGAAVSRPFNLDLADAGLPEFLTSLVGVTASGNLAAEAEVLFDLKMGLDLAGDDKGFFLRTGETGTKLSASAGASGADLNFDAKLGPFGLFVVGGTASLAADIDVTLVDANFDGRLNLLALGDSGLTTDLDRLGDFVNTGSIDVTGTGSATLPLFIGTADNRVPLDFGGAAPGTENALGVGINLVALIEGSGGAFSFSLPEFDFDSLELPGLFALLSDPAVIIDGLDRLLFTLQEALNGQIFGVELPFIGDVLADNPAANIIEDFRDDFLRPLAQTIRENNLDLDGLVDFLQQTIFDVLGPNGPFFHAVDFPTGLLRFDGNPADITAENSILVRFLDDEGIETENVDDAQALQFDFDLGKTFTFQAPEIQFDLGLPILGIEADFQPQITIDFDLHMGFGVDQTLGFYFVADHAEPELTLDVEIDFGSTPGDPAEAIGRLLFLALSITDGVDADLDGNLEFSRLFLNGSVDLVEPSGDGKLTFPELISGSLSDIVQPSLSGGASLRAHAEVDFSTIDPSLASVLPSISTDILVDFLLEATPSTGFVVHPPQVILADITLDLGSFISEFAGPILRQVDDVLGPLEWLIGPEGFLNKRIPLLSDLAGKTITGKDLVKLFDPENGPKVVAFLDFVEEIFFYIDLLGTAAEEGDVKIDFGDLVLFDSPEIALPAIVDRRLDLGLPSGISDLRSLKNFNNVSIPSAPDLTAPAEAGPATKRFTSGVTQPGSIEFSLLKPETIFKLLLGQPDVTLVTVDLPKFGFEFFYRQEFPIIGPLVGFFGGGISGGVDMGFGYDTRGLTQFLTTKNPANLVNGFFLTDIDFATGFDKPEAFLSATITVGGGLSIGLAKAGVEGGIDATVEFNLADLDGDGKVRFDEMASNVVANVHFGPLAPLAIFDVSGMIEFFMRAFVEINLLFTKIRHEYEFARVTLVEFDIPFERPALLASQSGDTLTLHIGPNAANRLQGNTADIGETIHVKTTSGGGVVVWSDQFNVSEAIASISPFVGVTKIVADGGAGNDVIDLSGVTHASISGVIRGGSGNDVIIGGAGADQLFGDAGNDLLIGNGGDDTLDGGEGNDTLHGISGNNLLLGGPGNDILVGGVDNDTLDGGPGDDQLDGGDGDDIYVLASAGSLDFITGGGDGLDILDFRDKSENISFFLRGGQALAGWGARTGTFSNPLNTSALGNWLEDFEHMVVASSLAEISAVFGGRGADTFHVYETRTDDKVTLLDGKQSSDTYIFYAEDGTPIDAFVSDNGNAWDLGNLIEVRGTDGVENITVTANDITVENASLTLAEVNQVIRYASPAADENLVQIKVKSFGGDDHVTVASTSTTVPVMVFAGSGDDTLTVGDGVVNNINGLSQPGVGRPFGLGPLVLIGEAGHDTVIIDDSLDNGVLVGFSIADDEFELAGAPLDQPLSLTYTLEEAADTVFVDVLDENGVLVNTVAGTGASGANTVAFDGTDFAGEPLADGTYSYKIRAFKGDIGYLTSFLETRTGDIQVEVGVVNGLGMTLNRLVGSAIADDEFELAGAPVDLTYTLEETATIVFVDVLDANDVLVNTIAGPGAGGPNTVSFDGTDFAGDPLPAGTYSFKVRAFIVSAGRVEFEGFEAVDVRLGLGADDFSVGVEDIFAQLPLSRQELFDGFTHTVDGMTTVSGGGGADTIKVYATNMLNRDALNTALGVVSATTLTEGVAGVTNEVQKVFVHASVGTFTLKFRFQETAPIAFNATAEEVKAALEKLFIIGANSVDVTKVSDGYEIEFVNDLGHTDVAQLEARVTPLAIFGGAGSDLLLVQAVNQDMFFLGEGGGDTVQLNIDIDSPLTPLSTTGVNAEVTLDGGNESDTYNIGLIGGITRSLINVFDSGGPGTDVLNIEGTDDPDLFLLRAAAAQSGLAFVALLNDGTNFERVNYNTNLETINIFSKEGDDQFYFDDTRAAITVFAGPGDDFFQVGQLYKSQRTTEQAGVAPEDVFATIETTRGWLSNGISAPLTINAGDGDDEFIVFHNKAVLTLNGEADEDRFLIQAFALVGSQEDLRERTDVSGGADADFIAYAVNAPVSINGGDGFDTVVVVGTEFSDDFVITEDGVFGAGINVSFVNVEKVEVSGAEGDDRFFILGTGATFTTSIVGDLGSDTFFINGPTPANGVISNDLRGHSGIITHDVSSTDPAYDGLKAVGVSANIADNDEPAIIVTESDGGSQVVEGGGFDTYTVVLSRAPRPDTQVKVSALPPQGLVFVRENGTTEILKDDGLTPDGVELRFDETNWNVAQTVRFKAIADGVVEGNQTAAIQHKVSTFEVITEPVFETQNVFETVPIFSFVPIFKTFNLGFLGSINLLVGIQRVQTGSFQVLVGTQQVQVDTIGTEATVSDAFTGVAEQAIGQKSDVSVQTTQDGDPENEIQTVTVNPAVGTYTLRFGLEDTAPIGPAETAEGLRDKLAALEGIGSGNVTVEKMDQVFTITFVGSLAATDVEQLIARVGASLRDDQAAFPTPTSATDPRPQGLRGSFVTIIDDPGNPSSVGQSRQILSNTGTVLTLDQAWDALPSNQARYEILQFNGLVIPTVEVSVEDADVAALVVWQNGGETIVAEGSASGSDTIEVSLSMAPAADEIVTVRLDGHGQLAFSGDVVMMDEIGAYLEFDASTYNLVQQVTVTAVADGKVEGFHRADLTLTTSSTVMASGYNGVENNGVEKTLVASVGDNDHAGVLIRESNGSTDVVEGGDDPSFTGQGTDDYTIVLTKAPEPGETVTVVVTAQPTRTSRTGSIAGHPDSVRSFVEQLEVSLDGVTFSKSIDVTFTDGNWDVERTVHVRAIDDDIVDGGDTKVFAPILDLANNIQGPLFIVGGIGVDRSGLFEREPVMLPGEVNFKDSLGTVLSATEAAPGVPATITIDPNDPDLLSFLGVATAADIELESLNNLALEITRGEGKNKVRFIENAEFVGDETNRLLLLTLNKAWDNPLTPPGVPDATSEYTLFDTNPNFFVVEQDQTDILIFNDTDNVTSFPTGFAVGQLFFDDRFGFVGHRITGLGMGGDRTIGGRSQPGGISFQELEEIEINLGTGANEFTIEDTHAGATTLNTGAGDDVINIEKISGHTFVNAGAGTDTINVHNDEHALRDLLGLLTVSGDIAQASVLNLANGSPAIGDPDDPLVKPVDAIQRLTVDATGGTFTLALGEEVTENLLFNISAGDLQKALQTLVETEFGVGVVDPDDADDDVVVTKAGNVYRISFVNEMGARQVDLLAVNDFNLTNGLGSRDILNIHDTGSAVPTVGVLTGTTLTGLSLPQANEIQTIVVDATQGEFVLSFDGDETGALSFDVSAAGLELALEALPGISTGNVAVTRNDDVYVVRFQGDLTNANVSQIEVASHSLEKVVELAGGATDPVAGTVTVSTRVNGNETRPVNDVQTLTVNASSGTYTLSVFGRTTAAIAFDASAEAVRKALQLAVADDKFEEVKTDVTVDKYDNVYVIGFQGKLRETSDAPGVDFMTANTAGLLGGTVDIATRMDGINYYGFENVDIDLGSGHDVFNVQGTTPGSNGFAAAGGIAVTNVKLGLGNEQVFISSNADLDPASAPGFDFLTGHLDDVNGALNLDFGAGRHRLMISDEAATLGDSAEGNNVDGSSVVITDTPGNVPGGNPTLRGLTGDAEIFITGLAGRPDLLPEGGISYKAAGGNFFDGIVYWTGYGDDTVFIDGTHVRGGADQRTTTMLNTGLGDDHVTVDLQADEDGFFVLNTMGGAAQLESGEDEADFDPLGYSDNDTVRASASTLPLIIFGGWGDDDIIAGQGNDIVFGDFGRVLYMIPGGTPEEDVLVAVLGFGGRGDMISSLVIDPRWVISRDLKLGGVDILEGQDGDDILIGGAQGDFIDGGIGRDLIFGDAVELYRRDIQPGTTGDITDPRFQALKGQVIYGRTDVPAALQGAALPASGNEAGKVLVNGQAQALRYMNGGLLPDWAEYEIIDLFHSVEIEASNDGSFGNDYIAGGPGENTIFGQLGDDTIQGNGSIASAIGENILNRILNFSAALDLTAPSANAAGHRFQTLDGADTGFDGAAAVDGDSNTILLSEHGFVEGQRIAYWNDGEGDDVGGLKSGGLYAVHVIDAHTIQLSAPVGAARIVNGTIKLVPEVDAHGNASLPEQPRYLLAITPSFEAATDGDDYIEGGGGNDTIFGGLGQDDIIGGSSSLFTLGTPELRPDGSDMIFGGAGTRINRNDIGQAEIDEETGVITTEPTGHARDADVIAGDNANIYRLVGINGIDGSGDTDADGFLEFNYDKTSAHEDRGTLRIIPRAVELLDYTPGGPDFDAAALDDIGGADEIHGEGGDDFIYGMKGDDILFGDGQDDDLIGGYGNDWISGGTGQDGVIGDDGRIFTSRNGTAEPLNGVMTATVQESISTSGNIQQAVIHVTGQIKKAVDLTPFSQDPAWDATQDEWGGVSRHTSDDIIYGGLGSDFLHGGSGDDAISGAEAQLEFFEAPINPGDVLGYSPTTGTFADYHEFTPLELIPGFLLNFNEDEGVLRPSSEYGDVHDDGDDKIFGDLGNDWLVGGTGRDNLYGGWGDDLLNADDDHTTNENLNDQPDTHPTYEDRAFGGAGRDVLIANTGGDRLIDWAGEFNSYLVPFAPFGLGTVSRMLQPQLAEFLYALSAADGADLSRAVDVGGSADPARNGEPFGELGLVRQQDFAWQEQTGAPRDNQPGNIPGGARDVLRSANFDSGSTSGFFADSGVWASTGGVLQVQAESIGKDAVSVFHVGDALPGYFEIQASVMAIKPTGGWNANSYIVFDYQGKEDFKFAGIDVSTNKLVMGHRDASGWHIDEQAPVKGGVKADKYYNVLLAVNGVNATLLVDNKLLFTHTYQPRIVDGLAFGLNWGMVGAGSNNSRGAFDNIRVQILPPEVTLNTLEDFSDGVADFFTGDVNGAWSVSGGRYGVTPGDATGFSLLDLGPDHLKVSSYLELNGTVNATGLAGYIFDRYGDTSFKFAAIDANTDQLVIGHYTKKGGWAIDASFATAIEAGKDYTLNVTLKGTTVSATLNPKPNGSAQAIAGFAFNAGTVDGNFGLLATGGAASFDDVRVKTDDPAFRSTTSSSMIAASATASTASGDTVTQAELDAIASVIISQWTEALGNGDPRLAAFGDVRFVIGDLADGDLGHAEGNTIVIDGDGAGIGWYVDVSPAESSEFRVRLDRNVLAAAPESEAYGRFDLVTVVAHELGHMLGFDHDDAGRIAVMSDDLDPGVRYRINSEQAEPVAAPAGTSGMPAFDLDSALGGIGLHAGVDWQGSARGNWRVELSPYAPPKPAKALSPNLAEFDAQPLMSEPASQDTGFDSLGRALLGKGKTDR